MALADIITKIEADAREQADAVLAEAQRKASELLEQSRAKAEREASKMRAAAQAERDRDAETIVVKARLAARDAMVGRHRQAVEDALAATVEALGELPDETYLPWLAEHVLSSARGGETLLVGKLDAPREDKLREELARRAPELQLGRSSSAAPFDRGALLLGDRVKADLSLQTLVMDQRDELELVIARTFLTEEG